MDYSKIINDESLNDNQKRVLISAHYNKFALRQVGLGSVVERVESIVGMPADIEGVAIKIIGIVHKHPDIQEGVLFNRMRGSKRGYRFPANKIVLINAIEALIENGILGITANSRIDTCGRERSSNSYKLNLLNNKG